MEITVRLFGPSKQYLPEDHFTLFVADGATVQAAVDELGLMDADLAELLKQCAIAVGDEIVVRDHVLAPGAELSVLPPVNGG